MKPRKSVSVFSRVLAALVMSSVVLAQTLPPPPPKSTGTEDQSPVELSPFVVSTTSDTGWVATETLAGSRLRTNFKDVPNQIETLTIDFMNDLGVNTFDDALIYSANVENANDHITATAGDVASNPS